MNSRNPPLTADRVRELLDYDLDSGVFTWRVYRSHKARVGDIAGRLRKDGYIEICVDGYRILAHRLAWLWVKGVWAAAFIDHRNTRRCENWFKNLREATKRVNNQNQRKARSNNKSCGLLGVTWNRGRWTAQITSEDGVRRNLGRFDTPEAAHKMYVAAKRRLHAGGTL